MIPMSGPLTSKTGSRLAIYFFNSVSKLTSSQFSSVMYTEPELAFI